MSAPWDQDQPAGLCEVDRLREDLREVSGAVSPWDSGRSRWKPSPWSGARINRPGSGSARVSGSRLREDLREGVQVQRRPSRPGALAGQVDAFTVERCQDQPAGLRLREGVRLPAPAPRGLREGNRHAPRSNLEPAGLREVDRLPVPAARINRPRAPDSWPGPWRFAQNAGTAARFRY